MQKQNSKKGAHAKDKKTAAKKTTKKAAVAKSAKTASKKQAPTKKAASPVVKKQSAAKKQAPKKVVTAKKQTPVTKKVAAPLTKKATAKKPITTQKTMAAKQKPAAKKTTKAVAPQKPTAKDPVAAVLLNNGILTPQTAKHYDPKKAGIGMTAGTAVPGAYIFEQHSDMPVLEHVIETKPTVLIRYSDDDLKEFEAIIKKKLELANAEYNYLKGLLTRNDGNDTQDTEFSKSNLSENSAGEREQLGQLINRQVTFIQDLERALIRIENKTYGVCRETGELIDKARLRAVPHATLSIAAKKVMTNNKGQRETVVRSSAFHKHVIQVLRH